MLPGLSRSGASSTANSSARGAIAATSSASWWPLNRSTEENMIAPSTIRATMLSSVWETSVPRTTGKFWRGRPLRRATTSAREGSPNRAGSVDDISTPMKVPCMASARRKRARGSAARRIASHENPRIAIALHMIASPSSTNVGLDASSAEAMFCKPIF